MPTRIYADGSEVAPRPTITTIDDGGLEYRLEWFWKHRLQGWYVNLYLADGTPLALGRRISPGAPPFSNFIFENEPEAWVTADGPSGYSQEDLGQALFLAVITDAELAEFAAAGPPDVEV